MELRLLRYFLAIAEERSITRAAQVLHITQPALSRQLIQLEQELGVTLFIRGKRAMELTEEGMLLKRRATEILSLVDITQDELAGQASAVEGHISIGMGELLSCGLLVDLVSSFVERYPLVGFDVFTGVADQMSERLDRGLLDFGLFLEPVAKDRYAFVRMEQAEPWVAVLRPDDPLAQRAEVTAADLAKRPLILPSRLGVQSELARWFGSAFTSLDVRFTSDLGTNACLMVERGLGTFVCVEGAIAHWDPIRLVYRPLAPVLEGATVLAWKRGLPGSVAVKAFEAHVQERLGA